MAKFIFPKTQILVRETNEFNTAVVSATDSNVFTCTVPLPANTEEVDKVYTLEVYTNDTATGITTTVTVPVVVIEYQAASITADGSNVTSTGGDATVNVTFQAPQA